MLVPIRRDRTTKPPVGTPLRTDGHWSVDKLYSAFMMQAGAGTIEVDLVSGLPTVSSVGNPQLSVNGLTIPGATNSIVAARQILNPVDGHWSYISRMRWTPAYGNEWYPIFRSYGDTNRDCGPKLREQYQGLQWILSGDNNVYFGGYNDPTSQTAGQHTWAVTQDGLGPTHKGYRDGKQLLAATYSGSVTESAWEYFKAIGANYAGCGSGPGSIDYILAYHRTLTDAEIASISDNPWQIFEPEIVWVEVGTSGEVGNGTLAVSSVITQPTVVSTSSLTGIRNGSVTVSNVAVTPTVAAPALSGIGNGIFSQPAVSEFPVVSAPAVSAGQLGAFSQPAVSTQPVVNAATITGIQQGSLMQPASTLQAAVLAATLTSGSVGSFAQPGISAQPVVSAVAITGQQQGNIASPAVSLQPVVSTAALTGSSVLDGTLATPQSMLQAVVQSVSLQAFEPVAIVQAFALKSTPVNIRFQSTPVNIQFRRVRP